LRRYRRRPRRRCARQAGVDARPLQCVLALAARGDASPWYPTMRIFRQDRSAIGRRQGTAWAPPSPASAHDCAAAPVLALASFPP
jgi:hypothetical protein